MNRTVCALLFVLFCSCGISHGFSFAVLGDNGVGEDIFRDIIHDINPDKTIRFVVNTGDLTDTGTAWEYKKYKSIISASRPVFYNVIGNHDIQNNGKSTFNKMFGSTYYSWDFEGSHFICLDNVSQRGLGRVQYEWLKADLAASRGKNIFVFMHKPLFDVSKMYPDETIRPKSLGPELISLFKRSGVKMVFCGHVHGYAREVRDGIVFIVSGGAGSLLRLPYFAGGFYNYVKVTVEPGRISDKVIKIE